MADDEDAAKKQEEFQKRKQEFFAREKARLNEGESSLMLTTDKSHIFKWVIIISRTHANCHTYIPDTNM